LHFSYFNHHPPEEAPVTNGRLPRDHSDEAVYAMQIGYGDYAFFVVQQHSDAELRALAPQFNWHTPFHYDPMPTLRADKVPQLWILGGEDYEAPSAETSRRIKSLMGDGLPFTLAYYSAAEHGMTLFETGADGSRISTRYASGYFRMIRDFARGMGSFMEAMAMP
jgi:hypothetical protein